MFFKQSNCCQKNTVLGVMFFFISIFLSGCNHDIPEGKGKVIIENEINDTCYIAKVWLRNYGDYKWDLLYDDGDEYNNQRYVRVYPDPGEYSVRVRVYYYDAVPVDIYSGIFSTRNVAEGKTTYLYFDGVSIHE